MRTILTAAFVFATGGSLAQGAATFSTIAEVMYVKAACGYAIDRRLFERALNANGLFSGDIQPNGRVYGIIRFFYDDLARRPKDVDATCRRIERSLNEPVNVWQGVIIAN